MSNDELVKAVSEAVGEMLRYATVVGKTVNLLQISTFLGQQAKDLAESDPDLVPEINAALSHLSEAVDAFSRLHQFAEARLDTNLNAL